jgi:hypothetical protein
MKPDAQGDNDAKRVDDPLNKTGSNVLPKRGRNTQLNCRDGIGRLSLVFMG